jgi:glutamate--cysteine ligase
MSQVVFEPGHESTRLTRETAIQYFFDGAKPGAPRVGVESELFLVDDATLAMKPFPEVETFLQTLAERFHWDPIYEGEHVVALERDGAVIALEPGGQLEYASNPFDSVAILPRRFDVLYAELSAVASERNENFLSLGLHPTEDFSTIPLIPKGRYNIMSPRLARTGSMAHVMMRGSCAWQCAIDYASEADFRLKFLTVFHVTSLTSALFASSGWEKGQPNHFASKRLYAWLKTDPSRCGLIQQVFSGTFGFEDYYEYVANVPMLFIVRNGAWVNLDITFAEFLTKGYGDTYATMEDWCLHQGTVYPEARLKHYIEVRGADANRFDWLYAFPALFVGMLASDALMEAACDLTRRMSYPARMELHETVAREGLAARCGRIPVVELVRELVEIAKCGLQERGRDEMPCLAPVEAYLADVNPDARVLSPPDLTRQSLRPYLLIS